MLVRSLIILLALCSVAASAAVRDRVQAYRESASHADREGVFAATDDRRGAALAIAVVDFEAERYESAIEILGRAGGTEGPLADYASYYLDRSLARAERFRMETEDV